MILLMIYSFLIEISQFLLRNHLDFVSHRIPLLENLDPEYLSSDADLRFYALNASIQRSNLVISWWLKQTLGLYRTTLASGINQAQ